MTFRVLEAFRATQFCMRNRVFYQVAQWPLFFCITKSFFRASIKCKSKLHTNDVAWDAEHVSYISNIRYSSLKYG